MRKYVDSVTKEEISILGMYDLVFQDMVKSYMEEYNYDNEDKISLTFNEIKDIAYKIIYKNEYVWEIINDTIEAYVGYTLNERKSDK